MQHIVLLLTVYFAMEINNNINSKELAKEIEIEIAK